LIYFIPAVVSQWPKLFQENGNRMESLKAVSMDNLGTASSQVYPEDPNQQITTTPYKNKTTIQEKMVKFGRRLLSPLNRNKYKDLDYLDVEKTDTGHSTDDSNEASGFGTHFEFFKKGNTSKLPHNNYLKDKVSRMAKKNFQDGFITKD
jgi:hypothetical protein